MKVPFIKIAKPDMRYFKKLFDRSISASHYTNFGPNERDLTRLLEEKIGYPTICTANATLVLDGLHHILSQICTKAYLPGFTFPATNLGCRIPFEFGITSLEKETLGFATFNARESENTYAITTAPFGSKRPTSIIRPNTTFWIVDNAAGTSPDMDKVRGWFNAGADAVICSLHATKILNGCEGGFVAFNNKTLQELYKKYISFGFYFEEGIKKVGDIGSNHKMSELTAAYVLMYYEKLFIKEYGGRELLANVYRDFCVSNDIEYIYSTQAFWIKCKRDATEIEKELLSLGIESRPYYRPLLDSADEGAKMLSKYGLCLPTWNANPKEIGFILKQLDRLV
jgi:DegT/DnrJ/EryC1/StrS aminotransferase family